MIPFLDMKTRNASRKDEFLDAIGKIIESGDYTGGAAVAEFECAFADYCGCAHAVAVGNGTEALWLTLLALGIGPGDEVITAAMTYVATAEAIMMSGARPVLVDIDDRTYTMNHTDLGKAISARTRAIIPVHLFGNVSDMDSIMEFAKKNKLLVIEDSSQAHGAEYNNRKAGSHGDAGCFSFYPSKNLGALGEAGAVVTQNGDLAGKLRMLRDHGQDRKSHHVMVGWNSRMDSIQAAVLRIKLQHLDAENMARRNHARMYDSRLAGTDAITIPQKKGSVEHVYHLYVICVKMRDQVQQEMAKKGIDCGVHYPTPVHLQPAFSNLGYDCGDFPVSEQLASEFLSLPMFPELAEWQIDLVISTVLQALGKIENPCHSDNFDGVE